MIGWNINAFMQTAKPHLARLCMYLVGPIITPSELANTFKCIDHVVAAINNAGESDDEWGSSLNYLGHELTIQHALTLE